MTDNEASFATNGLKGKRPKIHERVANFFRKRKEVLESLKKRRIFRQPLVFGSTIPAIAKVR